VPEDIPISPPPGAEYPTYDSDEERNRDYSIELTNFKGLEKRVEEMRISKSNGKEP